nr:unnamed protein product [Rangifer tarandus platyrhynchus]
MQPPWESPALARVAAVMVADGALRRSPSPREPRLRDLPALLRSGLILRRKRGAAGGQMHLTVQARLDSRCATVNISRRRAVCLPPEGELQIFGAYWRALSDSEPKAPRVGPQFAGGLRGFLAEECPSLGSKYI